MSVLVNLLPDTRQAKLRDRRRRQFATGLAILVWAVCGGIVLVLSLYTASQKLIINDLSKKIATKQSQLEGTSGLLDALTAQQHLAALPGLYSQRTYMTKFLAALSASDPTDVTVSSVTVDDQNTLTVSGNARTYAGVAKLAKALEAQNVTLGAGAAATNEPYFTNVNIQSVTRSGDKVPFTLNATVSAGVTHGSK